MELFQFSLALIFYYILHSVLAHKKIKSALTKKWIPQKVYRILFNVLVIGLLIPIFFMYRKIIPSKILEMEWLNTLGIITIGLGIILLFLSLKQYSLSEFSGIEQYRNKTSLSPQKLNTEGLNKWVRHPLYFSTLLLVWGFFLWHAKDISLLMALITTIYLYFGTKLEEEKLVEEFGSDYQIYQKEVPMLIPFL